MGALLRATSVVGVCSVNGLSGIASGVSAAAAARRSQSHSRLPRTVLAENSRGGRASAAHQVFDVRAGRASRR